MCVHVQVDVHPFACDHVDEHVAMCSLIAYEYTIVCVHVCVRACV